MRYLVGSTLALALVASPLSVSAQESKGSGLQYDLWETEPSKPEPALELELDDAGVEVTPSPPPKPEAEALELRVKRARIGLYVSTGVWVVGLAVAIPGAVGDCGYVYWGYATPAARCDPLLYTGITLAALGVLGMFTSGIMLKLAKRRRGPNRPRLATRGNTRRVQWDLERSRLVF